MSKPFIIAFEGLGSSGKTTVLDFIFSSGMKGNVGRCKFPLSYDKDNILSAYEYLMEMDRFLKGCKHDVLFVDRYKHSTVAYATAREEILDAGFWTLYHQIPEPDVVVYLKTTPASSAKRDYENKGVLPWVRESVYASFSTYFGKKGFEFPVLKFDINPASPWVNAKYKRIAKKIKKYCMNLYEESLNAK